MTVWRAKMNSGNDDVDWDGTKEYARRKGVVGVGWGHPSIRDGAQLEEVIATISKYPDWLPAGPQVVRRLKDQVADGDLVWTRDKSGAYWLGKIKGPWRYDGSAEATKWDLNNVRPCQWVEASFRDFEVPGAVVRSFVGAAAALRRVVGEGAARVTSMMFERETNPRATSFLLQPDDVITDLLDPTDVEDIALIFLQAKGWLLMPSSRMGDTPLYEAAFRHQDDGRIAVISVKSGANNQVPVEELVEAVNDAETDAEIFVCSTHDAFSAPPEKNGATAIWRRQLVQFMHERPELLPPRISRWLAQ